MNVAARKVKHAAPGPYLGFSLQPVRLCFHLLTCPAGAKVSLEYLDDVAVHFADASVALEQCKSALKQNPVSDWSDELWKTIANWIDAIVAGTVNPGSSTFRLYVTPSWHGDWAKALSDASTVNDAEAIFAVIEEAHAKLRKPKACEAHLQRFLTAAVDIRNAVITRFTLAAIDADPLNPLRERIKVAVAPELVDHLCQAAIGRAKEQADYLIRAGKPALLDGDTFKTDFIAFVRRINIPGLLTSLAPAPPSAAVAAVLSARPIFIRQLEIIEASEQDRVRAVSDFLRTSADKSNWAEKGMIFEGSLAEWDEFLVGRHNLISGEVTDLHADKSAAFRGRAAYRQCARIEAPLEGRAVPSHFVHGSFNALADIPRLGWHPEYQALLGEDDE